MSALAPLVKNTFRASALVLPTDCTGRPENTFPGDEDSAELDPNWLFRAASSLNQHINTVKRISAWFCVFIDDMSDAVCESWNAWTGTVHFSNVVVNAGVGMLPPGGMSGSTDMSRTSILSRMALDEHQEPYRAYADAIAGALEQAWTAWSAGYTCLTLPFPAAAIAGPIPPTPNVPLPLSAGVSAGDALMTAASLETAMKARFGEGQHSDTLFHAFASALFQVFARWKGSTMLVGIQASGGAGMPAAGALGVGGGLSGTPLSSGLQSAEPESETCPGPTRATIEGDAGAGAVSSTRDRPSTPADTGVPGQAAMASAEEVLDVLDGVRHSGEVESSRVAEGDGSSTGIDDPQADGSNPHAGINDPQAPDSSEGQAVMAAALGEVGFTRSIVAPFGENAGGENHG